VGIFTEPRRHDLPRPRGRDVWDVPESPEKRPFKLHETINRAPLIIVKKNPVRQEARSDLQDNIDSLTLHDVITDASMPSSPPRTAMEPHKAVESDVQIERHLPNGVARCTMISYRSDKPRGPRYEQCNFGGTDSTEHGPRCVRHVEKSATFRCEHVVTRNGNPAQCRMAGFKGSTTCSKHAEQEKKAVSSYKRKSPDDSHAHGRQLKSAKSQKDVTAGRESGVHESGTDVSTSVLPHSDEQNDVTQAGEAIVSIPKKTTERVRPKKSSKSTSSGKVSVFSQDNGAPISSGSRVDEPQDSQLQNGDGSHGEVAGQAAYTPEALGRVFDFLDLEKRPGRCDTELCLALKRKCVEKHALFQKHNLPFGELAQHTRDIQHMLKEVKKVQLDDDRRAVELDVYGYVFRPLTKVLKSLYSCLADNCDDIATSLEAMRIISPLVHDILALKDSISEWKISIPQRHNGDRIIKDANSQLIAPLREVEAIFSKRLSILEEKEENQRRLARFEQEIEEEDKEFLRQEEAAEAKRIKWDRWQALHIARMECEPDPRRRRHLFITKLEDLEEKDANGVVFERLPVFTNRDTLPLPRPSMAEAKPWSPEQETALLEGLDVYSGRVVHIVHDIQSLTRPTGPKVLHEIFRHYCRPGGLLRDFNVVDIVAQVSSLRSSLSKYYQENDWEIPAWVKQIPVLP
jgi:hypothetical protein